MTVEQREQRWAEAMCAQIFSAADAISKLAAQVATPVDWAATLQALVECGVDRILDLAPDMHSQT